LPLGRRRPELVEQLRAVGRTVKPRPVPALKISRRRASIERERNTSPCEGLLNVP
jgi:hypothetical protein